MADQMWKFLEKQKSNPEALKNAVDTLIAALVLSDDWQAFMEYRKNGGCKDGRKDECN